MLEDYIYGVDSGGTGLVILKVNPRTGEIIEQILKFSLKETKNITSNKKLTSILLKNIPKKSKVGIGAAGNVDEENLVIKYSPNSSIKGKITFPRELNESGREVTLTNDMRAAVQAVARYEPIVKKSDGEIRNIAVATYSSGFNAAVARNGEIVTQAELGHIIYKKNSGLYCGDGKKGHYEVFVSGNGAASMTKQYFSITKEKNHPIIKEAIDKYNKEAEKDNKKKYSLKELENNEITYSAIINFISAKYVYEAYRKNKNQEPQKSIRNIQVEAIADSFGLINSSFNPLDLIVCMGSQTKDYDVLFKPAIEKYNSEEFEGQLPGLHKPKIIITKLPEIGAQGAAAYFQYIKKR